MEGIYISVITRWPEWKSFYKYTNIFYEFDLLFSMANKFCNSKSHVRKLRSVR